jgi:TM2 domain-containing membrane protein YozV
VTTWMPAIVIYGFAYFPACFGQIPAGLVNNLGVSAVAPLSSAAGVAATPLTKLSVEETAPRNKSVAGAYILWFFLGLLGGHRYYLGKVGTGLLMTLTLGGLGLWWIVDAFLIPGMVRSRALGPSGRGPRLLLLHVKRAYAGMLMLRIPSVVLLRIKSVIPSSGTADVLMSADCAD